MSMRQLRPRSFVALLLTAGSLVAHGCASIGRDSHDARRAEESVERAATTPVAPLPLPAPEPRPIRRVAKQWPVESIPGTQAEPLAALVASPASGDAGAAPREAVRALDVPFAAGAFVLDARARRLLDGFAARLNLEDARYALEIQGHADASGTEAANIAMGLKRAEVVRSYLLAATTIPSERIAVISLGSGHPVADNSSTAGRAANRRVVVLALR